MGVLVPAHFSPAVSGHLGCHPPKRLEVDLGSILLKALEKTPDNR